MTLSEARPVQRNKILLHKRFVDRFGAKERQWPIKWDDVLRLIESWTEEEKTIDEMEELLLSI